MAYKTYSLNGCVKSGEYPIENAIVKVLNKEVTTNKNGEFVIDNLYGYNEINITHEDFYFDKISCDENNNNLLIVGYTDVYGNITTNNNSLENVVVSDGKNNVKTNNNGEFTLNKITIGETITFSLKGYKFISYKQCFLSLCKQRIFR